MARVTSTQNKPSKTNKFQFNFLLNIFCLLLLAGSANAQAIVCIADAGTGFETDQDTAIVTGNVLTNDLGANRPFNATGFSTTLTSGNVSFATDVDDTATFNYDPDGQFDNLALGDSDVDVFDYTAQDASLNSDSTQVIITINGLNDAPVADDDSGTGFSTGQTSALTTGNVLTNDDDVDDGAVLSITAFDATSVAGAPVVNNGDGTFSYNPTGFFALADGTSTTDTFTYTIEDEHGASDIATVTIAVTQPAKPSGLDLVAASDSGTSDSDDITNDDTPDITGSSDPLAVIELTSDMDGVVGTTTADGSGNWTITTSALSENTHSLTATAELPTGTTSGASVALVIEVDITAPSTPSVPDLDAGSDLGTSNSDDITSDDTPEFTGTGDANESVSIISSVNGAVGSATITGGGTWSVTTSALDDGTHDITATSSDTAGNTSAASAALSVTVDTAINDPSTPDLNAASDTGASDTDNVTNDDTPTFDGTGDIGDTVTITSSVDGVVGSDTVDGSGNWSITVSSLSDNDHDITAQSSDTAGNTSGSSAALSVTIDTSAPATPSVPDLNAASDSGVSDTDNLTNVVAAQFDGTSDPDVTISLNSSVDGAKGSATASGAGTWSVTANPDLTENTHDITATATDLAGNSSAATAALSVVVDITAPATPSTPDLDAATDSGDSNSDDITNDNTPDFSGTADANVTVLITSNVDGVSGATTSDGSGNWTITTFALTEGDHSITASSRDDAGNSSAASAALDPVTIDTMINDPSTPDLNAASDNGASSTDDVTNDDTPTFDGTADAGDDVTITSDIDGVLGTVTADGSGDWTFTSPSLTETTHSITAQSDDVAGNMSAPSAGLTVVIDVTAPAAPSAPDLEAASDSGAFSDDDVTNDTTPDISGTAEANSTVSLTSDQDGPVGSATADGAGDWTVTVSPALSEDTHSITAIATDVAGNPSVASAALSPLVIDITPPATPTNVDLDASSDTGDFNNDNITSDTTALISGLTEAAAVVTLTSSLDGSVGTGTANGSGIFNITTNALSEGAHDLTSVAVDLAGNSSAASVLITVTVDTTAPAVPSTPDLDASSDLGSSSTDNITSDNTPSISGTGAAGSLVRLTSSVNGFVGSVLVNGAGNWSVSTSALNDGAHNITATASDSSGNTSAASAALAITIDTAAPSAPSTPDLAAGSDTGSSSTDNITSDNTATFTGTSSASATVVLTSSVNGSVGTTTANGAGMWSITTSALSDGSHSITAQETDLAGNASPASAALAVTIDTAPPSTPAAPDLDALSDTGSSSTDNITSDTTPLLSGTAEANSTVAVTSSVAGSLGTTTANGSGNWTFTSGALAETTHNLTITATDTAGNTSSASSALAVTIDMTAPTAPSAPDLTAGSDTGSSSTDNITSDDTPTLSGTAEANSVVSLTSSVAGALGSATADGSGNWSFTSGALAEGAHNLTATSTDTAGNTSSASSALSVTIDKTAPSAPSAPDLTAGSDTGTSSTDNNTSDNTPTLTGTAEANSTVTLSSSLAGSLGTTTADIAGNWSFTSGALVDGAHSLTATSTDTAGNTSSASSALAVTIDTSANAPAALDLVSSSDTGDSDSDDITRDNTPTITGTADAGNIVTLTSSINGAVGSATTNGLGVWTITASTLFEGAHSLTAAATDTAGNASAASSALSVTIDRTVAAPAGLDLDSLSDTGLSSFDDITNDNTPTISGTAEANSTVRLSSSINGTVGIAMADGLGDWSITASAIVDGTHVLTASTTDEAGNLSLSSFALSVVIDTVAPSAPVGLDLNTGSDTGSSSTDDITFDNTPTISGTAEANSTVELTSDVDGTVGSTTADGSGNWSITASALTDGTQNLTATATDTAGNTSAVSTALTIEVDTVAPAAPAGLDLNAASDSGSSDSDDITSDNTPTVDGTAEANSTVELTSDMDGVVGSTTADGAGNWSITASTLSDNTHGLTATSTDTAGNTSAASTALTVEIDTTAPAAPAGLDLNSASDSGSSDSDDITSDNTPTIDGTAEANSTVELTSDVDGVVGSTTADGSGNWSITASALTDGTQNLTATATDTAGNTSSASTALTIEVDTVAPAAPAGLDLNAASDSGSSDSDDITGDNTPTIDGTAEANSTVELTSDVDGVVGSTTADGSGNWSITSTALTDGTQNLTATATDTAGNTSAASTALTIEVDTVAPAAPAGLDLNAASDTGASDSDDITGDNTPTVDGTAEANSTVELTSDVDGVVGSVAADGSGNWSITSTALTDGTQNLTATATDTAGNTSAASTALTIEVDTAAPAAPAGLDLNSASDSGSSHTDDNTSVTTPTIDGTAEANSTVELTSSIDGVVGSTTADGAGNWSITASALTDGAHNLTATATDTSGNTSAASTALVVTVDTSAPADPAGLDLAASSDVGASSVDNITNDTTPAITGTAEAGATVALTSSIAGAVGSATANGSGVWVITSIALADGDHSFTATATDDAGNVSGASTALVLTIDTSAPAAPAGLDLDAASDDGLSDTDDITSATTPDISGTAEVGANVALTSDVDGAIGSAVVDGGGHWTITTTALSEGVHMLTAIATDVAGNPSVASSALQVTIVRANLSFLWNSNLGMQNVVALRNNSDSSASIFDAVLRDNSGTELGRLSSIPVPAGGEIDVLLETIPGFVADSFGTLDIVENGTNNLDGNGCKYSFNDDGTSQVELCAPLPRALTGESFVGWNTANPTQNPAKVGNPVFNFLAIANDLNTAQSYTVEVYDSTNPAAVTFISGAIVNVAPRGRTDVAISGAVGQMFGTVRIIPTNLAAPYKAEIVRYAVADTSTLDLDFALGLEARPGSSNDHSVLVSTTAGGDDYLVVTNADPSNTNSVFVTFTAEDGTMASPIALNLAPFAQVHILVDNILGVEVSGIASITSSDPVIVENTVYFRDFNSDVSGAYAESGSNSFGENVSESQNSFLGHGVFVRLFNITSSPVDVDLSLNAQSGSALGTSTFSLPANSGRTVSVNSLPYFNGPDTVGRLFSEVVGGGDDKVVVSVLRVRLNATGHVDGIAQLGAR